MGCALNAVAGAVVAALVAGLGWVAGATYETYGLPSALAVAGGGATLIWWGVLSLAAEMKPHQ